MNVLFVHNNFPAQYRHLATALAGENDVQVCAIGSTRARDLENVRTIRYRLDAENIAATHPFARRFDLESRRAEQVLYALSSLSASGFVPDVIMAHPGWGETLPLRTLFPRAKFVLYCEFFYGAVDRDVGFDPEFFDTGVDGHVALHAKNAATLLALTECDAGVSPTSWQRSTFPNEFQSKIEVIHEGVDVDLVCPNAAAVLPLPNGRALRPSDEVVTFVARNLEPLRGYHIFMRALPRIMSERPNAEIVIIGADGVSYGAPPPAGSTWKTTFLKEIGDKIDRRRLHFMGSVPYQTYLAALQVSSAHVYLTYPFVLSWSLVEAMSAGCAIIASDTGPVRDIVDGQNGILTPFLDAALLAERVINVLSNDVDTLSMKTRARQTALELFDLKRICLPKMMSFMGRKTSFSEAADVTPIRRAIPASDGQSLGYKVKRVRAR